MNEDLKRKMFWRLGHRDAIVFMGFEREVAENGRAATGSTNLDHLEHLKAAAENSQVEDYKMLGTI